MAKVICYLVVAAITTFFSCTSASTLRHSKNRTLFQEHMERVNAFSCSQPQLRAVKPEELGLSITSDESYYPSSTVLTRCSCAGYCSNREHTCAASRTETVELVFKVMNHVNGHNSSDEYRRVNATNEIECSCQTNKQIK